jgi:hypothetical protein
VRLLSAGLRCPGVASASPGAFAALNAAQWLCCLMTTWAEKLNSTGVFGATPVMPKLAAVPVTGGAVQVTADWLCMPWPLPFAWVNENSPAPVVRLMKAPEKLTGIPCIDDETLPVPQATEWSLVVVVTVTVSGPNPVQVSVICSLPALLTPAARSTITATIGSARRRRISPPFPRIDTRSFSPSTCDNRTGSATDLRIVYKSLTVYAGLVESQRVELKDDLEAALR